MSRGGTRYGAGRPALHAKTGGKLKVDVRRLQRAGNLSGSQTLTLRWQSGASIQMETCPDTVRFLYRYKDNNGEWQEVNQAASVTWTPCHYGGARPWFECPRCCGRVAILYLWNLPKCRKCARLVYPSQSVDAIGRSWNRTEKIDRRLSGGTGEWNFRRPKGMRRATFERLRESHWREEMLRDDAIAAFMVRHGMI